MTKPTFEDKKRVAIAYLVAMTFTILCFATISQVVHSRDTIRYIALLFLCFTSFAGIFSLIILLWKLFGKIPSSPTTTD